MHDAVALESYMKELNNLDGFEYGAPPGAGCGIGLERLGVLFNLGRVTHVLNTVSS